MCASFFRLIINGPSINIFYKNFNFSFYNSSRLPYEVRKYQKINLLASKGRSYSDNMYILPLLFLFLLFKIFLRKRKSDPRLKNYSYQYRFLVYILKQPRNRLKSCFTCQFFTHGIIEIKNEFKTSYFHSELRIFAISKFIFKNDSQKQSCGVL